MDGYDYDWVWDSIKNSLEGGRRDLSPECKHEWVDLSLYRPNWKCIHCGVDRDEWEKGLRERSNREGWRAM